MTFICSQSFIHHFTGLFGTNIMTSFLVGLVAQLVEHCTGIAEVMGLNPVQAWIFFQALFSLLLKKCSLLRRSLSYSRLYLQFQYITFLHSQSFKDSYVADSLENWFAVSIPSSLEFPFFVFSAAPSTSCTRTFMYESWIEIGNVFTFGKTKLLVAVIEDGDILLLVWR